MDLSKQDAVLSKLVDIGQYSVKDFCNPIDVRSVGNIEDCHPDSPVFGLSAEVEKMLKPLYDAYNSSTFVKLWEKQCTEQQEYCTSLEDVVKNLWIPVNER